MSAIISPQAFLHQTMKPSEFNESIQLTLELDKSTTFCCPRFLKTLGILSSNSSHIEHSLLRRRRSSSVGVNEDEQPPALNIIGSINEEGLGMVHWWEVD